jgi:hypothetical protein
VHEESVFGSILVAREVSSPPSGWGLVVAGVLLVVGGVLLGLQARAVWGKVDRSNRWKGSAGMFGYMGALGVFVAVPVGMALLVVGVAQVV